MLRSVAELSEQIADCRQLHFYGTFYSLPKETADELIREVYYFICNQFENRCVLDWKIGNRTIKNIDEALETRKMKNGYYTIELDGNVLCEIIYNKTSFRKYKMNVMNPPVSQPTYGSFESVDLSSYYDELITPYMRDYEVLKKKVLQLFDLDGMVRLGSCLVPDVNAFFSCTPMDGNDLFNGEINIWFSTYCLNDELDHWTGEMCSFGKKIAEKYPRTNVCMKLTSLFLNHYSEYYGIFPSQNEPLLKKSLFRNYSGKIYIAEVGWAHIVSKETRTLGKLNSEEEDKDLLQTEELPGGALFVRAKRPISQLKMTDLKAVKRCIYDLVLPREQTLGFEHKLRRYWEYVPVFENELSITDKGYMFKHYGTIDTPHLCELAMIDPKKMVLWK